MQEYNLLCFSISAALIFGILQGVCGVLADKDTVMIFKTGSLLNLTVTYPKDSVSYVDWKFNDRKLVEYYQNNYTIYNTQFRGRLKVLPDIIGIILQDLQPRDSGAFSIVAYKPGSEGPYPTQSIKVDIQSPITAVQIEKTQTWNVSTNSCDVDVSCAAPGAERVSSYLWSGYKTASGAQLQFSLSPAEGAVTLNCTAANNVSSRSMTQTLSCSTEHDEYKGLYVGIAAGGVFAVILIIAVAYWICCKKPQKAGSADDGNNTLYAEVNPATTQKDNRSDSVTNGMTVYETVSDIRITPETIYAQVNHPQHKK